MPSSSPYQANDYQAANSFRPNRLPVNDIMKAFVSQNQFWDAGAKRVKNAYENALNLNLTSDENIKVKNDYIKDAEKQLNKISAMDLSDPSVQRLGLNIFKPLLQDRSIILDNEMTNLKNSIVSDAEGYKTKKLSKNGKEGEGYSDINLVDALTGFEGFNSSTPRDEKLLKDMYGRVKGKRYVPYYSPNEAFENALKGCKGAVNQSVIANGLNDDITKSEGITAETARDCIETYLSNDNKAMEQIAINGRVNFKDNRPALINAVQPYLQKAIDSNDMMLRKYEATLLALKTKNAPQEQIDIAQAFVDRYKSGKQQAQKVYNETSANNWKQIDDNYNEWAQRIYKYNLVSEYATPRATYGEVMTSDANAGRLEQFRQQEENNRATLNYQKAFELEDEKQRNAIELKMFEDNTLSPAQRMELMLKYGFSVPGAPNNLLTSGEEVPAETLGSLQSRLDENYNNALRTLGDLRLKLSKVDDEKILSSLASNPTSLADYQKVIDVAMEYIDAHAALKGGKDKLSDDDMSILQSINEYRQQVSLSNSLLEIKSNAEQKVKDKNPNIINEINSLLFSIDSSSPIDVKINNKNSKILYSDIINAITGTNGYNLDIQSKTYEKNNKFDIGPNRGKLDLESRFSVYLVKDGKKYEITDPVVAKNINEIQQKYNQKYKEYVTKVNTELKGSKALNKFITAAGDDKYTEQLVSTTMKSLFPSAGTKEIRFQPQTTDVRTGEVVFQVYKKEKDKEKLVSIDGLEDLADELGKPVASIASVLDYKNGKLVMTLPELKMTNRTTMDDSIDLMKEYLDIRSQKTKNPESRVIYTSSGLVDYILEATPLSSGTVYSIKSRKRDSGTYYPIQGQQNITADKVNAAIANIIANENRSIQSR